MTTFATIVDREHPSITIDRAEIEASTDVPQLTLWYGQLDDQAEHVSHFLRAYRDAEVDDEDYFERSAGKLAFLRIATRWIERRLLILGAPVPYPPTDPRSRQLRLLQEKVEKLTNRLAKLEKAA